METEFRLPAIASNWNTADNVSTPTFMRLTNSKVDENNTVSYKQTVESQT
jgi:hypothetical protein